MSETDFFLGNQGISGTPIDPDGPGGSLIDPIFELSTGPSSPIPAMIIWNGVSWQYSPVVSGGPGIGDQSFIVNFDYTTPSPVVITVLNIGDVLLNTELRIDTPFNDPVAILEVGDIATPGKYLGATEIMPNTTSLYTNNANFDTIAAGAARLTINPGGSTQGSGQVILTVRKI